VSRISFSMGGGGGLTVPCACLFVAVEPANGTSRTNVLRQTNLTGNLWYICFTSVFI
jgi:hypothetical protein